jgi:hypothetical protein
MRSNSWCVSIVWMHVNFLVPLDAATATLSDWPAGLVRHPRYRLKNCVAWINRPKCHRRLRQAGACRRGPSATHAHPPAPASSGTISASTCGSSVAAAPAACLLQRHGLPRIFDLGPSVWRADQAGPPGDSPRATLGGRERADLSMTPRGWMPCLGAADWIQKDHPIGEG